MMESIYGNINTEVDAEDAEEMTGVAKSVAINNSDFRTGTNNQTPQQTGNDSIKTRSSRAAAVCLVLLCFLLLTAVIALFVLIYIKHTNYTQERNQLLTRITNSTEERDDDRNVLLTKIDALTKEKDQLDQNITELWKKLKEADGWLYYQSSLYFISSITKNWNESRSYCIKRGADLIIINNTKEQEFVNKISHKNPFWIGVTDDEEEGRWKWVDGTNMTTRLALFTKVRVSIAEQNQIRSPPFLNMSKQTKMSQPVYGNIDTSGNQTESNSVKMRSSRAAPVCLVLLCFLLLTAVIVLSVFIYTNNTNYTNETNQLLTNITNITEGRDMLNKTNQLENQLLVIDSCTQEKSTLLKRITTLTEERGELRNNIKLIKDLLNQERNKLWKILTETDGWIYRSSFYYVSAEEKSWTESRRDCREKGADLVIINNREEQDFVTRISDNTGVWIGLTDGDEEGRWKWVDGSPLTSGFSFWAFQEPNGKEDENCAVHFPSGWYDYPCNNAFKWICKKTI